MGCGRRSNIGNPANLPNYEPAMDMGDGCIMLFLMPFALFGAIFTYGFTLIAYAFLFIFLIQQKERRDFPSLYQPEPQTVRPSKTVVVAQNGYFVKDLNDYVLTPLSKRARKARVSASAYLRRLDKRAISLGSGRHGEGAEGGLQRLRDDRQEAGHHQQQHASDTEGGLMERQRWWRVTAWGSGFGKDGGLCATPEEADDAVIRLIDNVGWSADQVCVEELSLTPDEWEEIAKTNRPTGMDEWHVGPRGGVYRLSSTGRSRVYI